ncbi:polysaccharide deacetylase family protein [Kyrpidia tusciae]|uniref:Polysaccharide deacetylase n=1 Tax=Kyrpidia tusciae (strain DSM 2912 / NBRC 15312 / T2) TaxID=562970 RepID=D5WVU4_KYRT2|nr:polysaccharide deacetylase family protein [Kyrpidia tusciae]ADG07637.1 polysaccharide deacetylase [Kyrpidia tusciae DSM 2912]
MHRRRSLGARQHQDSKAGKKVGGGREVHAPRGTAQIRRRLVLWGFSLAVTLTGCTMSAEGPAPSDHPSQVLPTPGPPHLPVSQIARGGQAESPAAGTWSEIGSSGGGAAIPDPLGGVTDDVLNRVKHSGVLVPILMYHSISHNPGNRLCVDPATFAEQMEWLTQNGYTAVTLADLLKAWAGREVLPAKPVVITFDDGYKDVMTAAYPVLKNLGLRATVFVITDFVGKPNYVSWEDLESGEREGIFDVESHTVHHLNLASLPKPLAIQELQASKATIEEHLHKSVYALCYPAGSYDPAVEKDAEETGYLVAVTTRSGPASLSQGRYALHRLRISGGESLTSFAAAIGSLDIKTATGPGMAGRVTQP